MQTGKAWSAPVQPLHCLVLQTPDQTALQAPCTKPKEGAAFLITLACLRAGLLADRWRNAWLQQVALYWASEPDMLCIFLLLR